MGWFEYLLNGGFLNPEKNPEPVAVDKGYTIPRWEALAYLEKLSSGFDSGENLELIESVVDVIKNVSENPKDNYYTWYVFIKILTNIPNDRIPTSILEYIPTWMNGRFDTMLQSSEIIEKLLPKFLENPSENDKKKAEVILKHLFDLCKNPHNDLSKNPGESYYSRVHLYYLHHAFNQGELSTKIARYAPVNIIYTLLDRINLLIRDYAVVAPIINGSTEYNIKLTPKEKELQIEIQTEEGNWLLHEATIENYIIKTPDELTDDLEQLLSQLNIPSSDSRNEAIKRLRFGLTSDFHSIFAHNPIQDLHNDIYHDENVMHVFAYILRELLSEMVIEKPDTAKKVFFDIIQQQQYNLPFFKRMVLYCLTRNWNEFKDVFFQMINDTDPSYYFSAYVYNHELYYLLRSIQKELTIEESKKIASILKLGPQIDKEYQKEPEVWKHRWLDALKENDYFKKEYEQITENFGLNRIEYEEEGKLKFRVGNISPHSEDQILSMENSALLQEILTFRNGDRFEDPSIEGFAEQLMKAAEINPNKFVEYIDHYQKVSYIYIYYIVMGITTAWKNHKTFDWKKLLNFCKNYIDSDISTSNKVELQDQNSRVKKRWLAGTFGRLISEGTSKDENAFDSNLLTVAKEILLSLANNLEVEKRVMHGERIDYPMLSLNSTAGQVLRGVLDYALRKARLTYSLESIEIKWEAETRDSFEAAFNKGIIEGYILVGMYLQQFYYLDNKWLQSKVKSYYNLDDEKWLAFIGGLGFTSPAWNKEIYELLYPHYKRAFETKDAIDTHYRHGLIRHVTAYYLWDFDTHSESSLMSDLIILSEEKIIRELIQFLWQEEKYLNTYSQEEQINLKSKILVIWKMIADRFQNSVPIDDNNILGMLVNLAEYIDCPNDENINLILKSAPYAKDYHATTSLLETLLRFIDCKEQKITPKYVANILSAFDFSNYLHDEQQRIILELVRYLFQSGEQDTAEYLCNKLTIKGYVFLKDVYHSYKKQ